MTTTTTYLVDGMTCSHCVYSVTSELTALESVSSVTVDLHPESVASVTVISDHALERSAVAAAIQEAGYALVDAANSSDAEPSS